MKKQKRSLVSAVAMALSLTAASSGVSAMSEAKTTQFWWPEAINLSPLRQHAPQSNPYGDDFDYAAEFAKLDLDAVKSDIEALLSLQDGNVGNSVIPTLLLVSVDIRSFTGANERNQMWIDGGIFLQQLLLAIHAKGWGSCPMNFSATNNQAAKLRSLAGLADYEEVIAFVSVGETDKSIAPAASIRKPVGDLLVFASLPTSR